MPWHYGLHTYNHTKIWIHMTETDRYGTIYPTIWSLFVEYMNQSSVLSLKNIPAQYCCTYHKLSQSDKTSTKVNKKSWAIRLIYSGVKLKSISKYISHFQLAHWAAMIWHGHAFDLIKSSPFSLILISNKLNKKKR